MAISRHLVQRLMLAWTGGLLLLGALEVAPLLAQRREVYRTPWGKVLDFAPDGVWRKQAAAVASYRRALLARGQFEALNGPMGSPSLALRSPAVVSGVYAVPAILFRFKDVGTAAGFDTSTYRQVLFGNPPLAGRPYSLRTYYEELSNGLLSIQGNAFGWVTLDSNEVTYTGVPGTCSNPPDNLCNGINSADAFNRMQNGLREALAKMDPLVDFSQYDSNGDGFVDLVIFVQSEKDGACGGSTNNHIWAHRGTLSPVYTTGEGVKVRDYTVQSGLGGSSACDTTQVMPVGTTAHETGHGFNLPDLYDTEGSTEGIGEWGLMGSGNYTSAFSPSRMEAWSLNELGWITLRPLSAAGTYALGAAPTADTAFYVRVQGSNPRGEYFLIENRQAAQSDTAMIRILCQRSGRTYPTTCGGGMAIWHVDSTKIAQARALNQVNAGSIHGVALVQADNLGQLDKSAGSGGNRGDAGDLYPGTTGNQRLSYNSAPAAVKNSDGTFVGFEVDSIKQVTPGSTMSLKLTVGGLTRVHATDTRALVQVDGITYASYAQILPPGSNHTVSIDSAQVTSDTLTQFLFVSWSDGGARTHSITAQLAGDSIVATVAPRLRVKVAVSGNGTVASQPSANLAAGTYVKKDSTLKVWAAPATGNVFEGWSGDTTGRADTLVLTVSKPYTLAATFAPQLVAATASPPEGITGKAYSYTLSASGGTGSYAWSLVAGSLPPGLSLSSAGQISGTPTTAGSFSSTARVASGSQTADVSVAITVVAALVASAGNPPAGIVGQPYSHTLTATGGTGSYTWQLGSGSLPAGLSLGSGGAVTGTPTTAGSSSALVRVTSGSQTDSVTLNITILAQLAVVVGTPPPAVMGKSFSHQLSATGGTGTYTWQVASGSLPDGLSLNSSGLVSGIPAKTGSFTATVRATSGSQTAEGTLALTVTAPQLVTANVVSQILGTRSPLTADELKYLDLLGNNNGSFDVGDFLAWVKATGAPAAALGPAAALVRAAPQAGSPAATPSSSPRRIKP